MHHSMHHSMRYTMRYSIKSVLRCLLCLVGFSAGSAALYAKDHDHLGARASELIDAMDEGALKSRLQRCDSQNFLRSDFSIGHRGAPLRFPEHTKESYVAAAEQGAGLVECDVTFTKDRELVCRHSQCDLHTTTNILQIPELAAKCSVPFTPAKLHQRSGEVIKPAFAKCCTTDISVQEFKSLKGKRDSAEPSALTVEAYLKGRRKANDGLTLEYGELMTHAQSIELFTSLGVAMTPELKSADVDMPYDGGFTQTRYAQKLVDEYLAAGVPSAAVRMQSFNLDDLRYWVNEAPEYAKQAVFLDGRYSGFLFNPERESSWNPSMRQIKAKGINTIAPPIWVLLRTNNSGQIVPSLYAIKAKEAGLNIVTWTLERSGSLSSGGGWYYQSVSDVINNDGDMYKVLDVLAKDVGVTGVFSDWPETVTFYANCAL